MAARCARLAVAVLAMAVATAACSGVSVERTGADSDNGAESDADIGSGLAVLDETIPPEDIHGDYWPQYDDLRSISCASDVAFVGRVTGYTERLLTIPPDPEDPDPDRVSDVYDGLVFAVDDLLAGNLDGSGEVMVAFRALRVNADGSARSRITGAPFVVIRPGIEQRDDPDGPRYLVYSLASEPESPWYRPGVFFFNTNGGVTQVLGDDALDTGAHRPFGPGHGFGLADAQAAARAAELSGCA